MCVHVCVCVYCVHMCECVYVYSCVCTCMHACVCGCVWVCVFTALDCMTFKLAVTGEKGLCFINTTAAMSA